jgi:hypothetical protein
MSYKIGNTKIAGLLDGLPARAGGIAGLAADVSKRNPK